MLSTVTFTDLSVVPAGPVKDGVVELGHPGGLVHPLLPRGQVPVPDVVQDRVVEEDAVLGNHGDLLSATTNQEYNLKLLLHWDHLKLVTSTLEML